MRVNFFLDRASLENKDAKVAKMATLVQRAQAGEREAFGDLVEAHADRIYTYLLHLVGDREEAEDLAQETFVRAWESLDRFRGGAAFSTWLYRIATNLAIDAIRRRQRRGPIQSIDAPVQTDDGELDRQVAGQVPAPDEDLFRQELQRAVWESIRELPPKLQPVLVLYDFEQLSYEDISRVLLIPLGTVKSRLFHARQQLKRLLSAKMPVDEYLSTIRQSSWPPVR
ncbi:MAG: sigma-70 family RNA polymerase sigma factor [Armatimonadetes bacterium]|nr:sigma-70 family RNA polymerase sigma factor [Armatimonadota bacterium]